jgi:PKD repeat protein
VDRSNSTIKPDVWYTVKLKVTAHPFTFAAEVYTENGTFLGTHTVDTINNFTFEDIRYVGMSSGHGGTFYVRNITGIAPTSAFDFTPDEPAAFSPVVFNASGSGPQDATANFTWDFGDGNVTTTQLPVVSHVYESAGSFNVTLTVVDSEGYSGSSSQVVRVWLPSYLSISTDSSFTTVGSVVNINGRLSEYSGAGLTNEPVAVYYTFAGADSWYPISSAFTDGAGGYSIQWINSASGTFTLKAQWSGNATHTGANATATLSSLPYRSEDAFFVESNSTVTSLAFNSTSSELSFTASGAPGTVGYVKATIAKSLVPKGSDIRVQLDGKQLNYSLTETEDSWLLTFTYSHSTHRLSVYLPIDAASAKETTPPPSAEAAATPAPTNTAQIWSGDYRPLFVIIGIVAAIAVMGALFLRRKNTPEILQH